MEFFRAGEALIRSTQPLCLQFLAPTVYRAPSRIGALSRRDRPQQWQCQSSQRTFSSSPHDRQQSTAAERISELVNSLEAPPRRRPQERESELLGRARGNTPLNDPHLSRPRSGVSSTDELISNLLSPAPKRATSPRSTASSTGQSDDRVQGTLDNMKRGTQADSAQLDIASIFATSEQLDMSLAPIAKAPVSTNDPAPIKLNATTGRVIHINQDRGIDAARAFRMLGMRLNQNSVKRDAQMQRFHERPGLKRKRLKSVRWRKRFKEAFQGTVARVVNMKRQGW